MPCGLVSFRALPTGLYSILTAIVTMIMDSTDTKPNIEVTPAIETHGLSKFFGKNKILEGINLKMMPGEVYALAGPNGAGKTTLIKLMTGLSFPTSGRVLVSGEDVHKSGPSVRRRLGAVVEAPAAFYPHLTGRDNLRAQAMMSGGLGSPRPGEEPLLIDHQRIREVLNLVELLRMADRPVREYSLGQRQRLGLASAILGNPQVLILDEPTSGLDPLGIGLVHRVLSSLASGGTAVILSTHHLREVSSYAHKVTILGGGRVIDEVGLRDRQNAYRFRVDDPSRAAVALSTQPFIRRAYARAPYVIAHLDSDAQAPEAIRTMIFEGLRVFEAAPDTFDLYEYYRERVERP